MSRPSVHVFMGNDMAPVAGAISNHIKEHSSVDTKDKIHILTIQQVNKSLRIKDVENKKSNDISNEVSGIYFFQELFTNTITIEQDVENLVSELYLCIYIQLYDAEQLEILKQIVRWIKNSDSSYKVDIYGISYDLARLFCVSEEDKIQLIDKNKSNKDNTQHTIDSIVDEVCRDENVKHFLLMQNLNFNGLGLNLDKDTFIRILGEFAILTSEQYYDVFSLNALDNHEIYALGISDLWFDKAYFHDFLLRRSLLTIYDRAGLNAKKINNQWRIINRAQQFIEDNLSILDNCYVGKILPCVKDDSITEDNKEIVSDKINEELQSFENVLNALLEDNDLSLKEKRLLYALLLREDDELMDDEYIIEKYPSFDECFKESIDLYVDENNRIIDEGGKSILSGPIKDNHIYNPIEELSDLKVAIRKSKSFIRKSEERLEEIQEGMVFDNDSRKVIVNGDYIFGDNKFRLLKDVVEEPLEETYVPHDIAVDTVDIRDRFSSIRSQGRIGSCTAFATSSMFEYILNCHDSSSLHILSPRFLYYNVCEKNSDGTPIDAGSSYYKIMNSLGVSGICEETLCPYEENFANPPSSEAFADGINRLVTKAMNVNVNPRDIKSALADGYPVGISLRLFDSFKANSMGFIFRPTDEEIKSGDKGWHAMVICGFSEKHKVYIVRNSWGEDFGDNGYCYIPFSYIEDPNLCRQACIITGVSCNEFCYHEVSKDVDFDLDSKEAEYAALRILLEEEKLQLSSLQKRYSKLQGQYITLLAELTHIGKRSQIKNHALSNNVHRQNVDNGMINTELIDSDKGKNTSSLFIGLCVFVLVVVSLLIGLYYTDTLSGINCSIIGGVTALVSIILYNLFNKKKPTVVNPVVVNEETNENHLHLELKFRVVGRLLDGLKEIRNKIEKDHRRITSYLLNLTERNETLRKTEITPSAGLRSPFITILESSDYERIFESYKEAYIGEVNLSERFADYEVDKIKEFFDSLSNEISNRISNSCNGFSMCKYIYQTPYEPYSNNEEIKLKYLQKIENQSLPFAKHNIGHSDDQIVRLLIVNSSDSEEQKDFDNSSLAKFVNRPQSCFGGTPYKLTYIQVVGCRRDELSLYNG